MSNKHYRPSMGQFCILRTLAKAPSKIFTTRELQENNPYFSYGGFYSGAKILVERGMLLRYGPEDVAFYFDDPSVNSKWYGRKPFCYQITQDGLDTLEYMKLNKLLVRPRNSFIGA